MALQMRLPCNTIAWSYDLLGVEEQQLFRHLSIFVGGCTLAAAESIYGTFHRDALHVLNGVTSLIDKSLLQQTEQEREEPRLLMLETIREYGLGIIRTLGEMESARKTHTHYYLRLAEDAETEIGGPQQAAWLDRLEQEHDNLRAAMQWVLERPGNEGVVQDERRTEMALRLGGALRDFWRVHGHISEGRNFLKHALTTSEGIEASVRAKALIAAGNLAFIQSDYERTETLCQESLALYRELEDQPGIAHSVYLLGIVAWTRGDTPTSRSLDQARVPTLLDECRAISREIGFKEGTAASFWLSGQVALEQRDLATARQLSEKSVALYREMGHRHGTAESLLL